MENECDFCKEFEETFNKKRPGECYGCKALNDNDYDDQEEGEF